MSSTVTQPTLFDGAMGTYLESEYGIGLGEAEDANILHPDTVTDVHRRYIDAGAQAILTNTFAANTVLQNASWEHVAQIVDAACANAQRAVRSAGRPVRIFGCIGPIYGAADPLPEYRALIDQFLQNDICNIALQTFAETGYWRQIAEYLKMRAPDAYLLCQGTVAADGYTPEGVPAQRILDAGAEIPQVDAVGFNCTCGPAHMLTILQQVRLPNKSVAAMPNAGYPHYERGRTVYATAPEYYAKLLEEISSLGIAYVGGCCGTTPAHIAASAQAIMHAVSAAAETRRLPAESRSADAAKPQTPPRHYVAVELDPPANPAKSQDFFARAIQIRDAGADIITIADCPVGRARGDSSLLAAVLQQSYGIATMPHLTCRDRNLNATQALLLGLNMADVHNVLVVTGDPVPAAERERVKTVFQFNSVRMAEYIRELNQRDFASNPFAVSGALNVNAVNFAAELDHARRKVEAGIHTLLTQPVMDGRARENLIQAREVLGVPVLAGIMPVVSYKNAVFVNNEMGGITVPGDVLVAYENASREKASELAVEYALRNAQSVRGAADGYYIITTLGRADIVSPIVQEVKRWES